jgi:cation transporter-like permease
MGLSDRNAMRVPNRRLAAPQSGQATNAQRANMTKIALIVVPLLAILAAAAWYASRAWTLGGPPIPTTGYVAMILGVVFSLVVGCGLMALLFYSSRHGYDEPHRSEDEHE